MVSTLKEFAVDYAVRRDVSDGYSKQLVWCVGAFDRYLGRDSLLSDLTAETINAFLADQKKRGLSADTRKSRKRMLMTMATDAADLRLIEPVQRERVAKVKTTPTIPDGLSWEEANTVIRAVMHRGGPHERWLRYRYKSIPIRRRDWWSAYLRCCWDTGAPADVRTLEFSEIREGGRVYKLRSKTGKLLAWQLSTGTLKAIEAISEPERVLVFQLPGRLELFRREAKHIIQEIAGLDGKTLGGFRSGAGSDAEFLHGPGAGCSLLGNTPEVFRRHYEIPELASREPKAPRPINA